MPLSKHYNGHGEQVMRSMKRTYDPETAKRVFYATENARKSGKKRGKHKKSRRAKRGGRRIRRGGR